MRKKVGIIGGGASGMMAAVTAAQHAEVTLLEHTARIGKKILSTGNGKCNYTNRALSKDDYYCDHPSFVAHALSQFDDQDASAFFAANGMLTSEKRDGYCYPYTGQAATVLNVLRLLLEEKNVTVKTEQEIESVTIWKDGFYVKTKTERYRFDKLILACGGNAAPQTGSDGSGYALAKSLGHTLRRPYPALTYLLTKDPACKELAGVRANAMLTLSVDGEQVQTEEGELQLNKDSLSGIPVFQLSHRAIQALAAKKKTTLSVDFLPQLGEEDLLHMLAELQKQYGKQPVEEVLALFLHKKICGALLHRLPLSFQQEMQMVSDKQLKKLARLCKGFVFEMSGYPGFDKAQVTMGGIPVSEIDDRMQSRKVKGLYFAGEIIDVDGRCGGYNLQWAWTSGYIAGLHCSD